jgi:hypothetical protein
MMPMRVRAALALTAAIALTMVDASDVSALMPERKLV